MIATKKTPWRGTFPRCWGGGGGVGLTYYLDTCPTSRPSTWLRLWHSRVATTGLQHCGDEETCRQAQRGSERASERRGLLPKIWELRTTSFFFLSICRRFKFEAQIWAPTWRQFAQFFFVEYSCLQGRVLQARFASAFIRSAARLLRNHFWLIDWLIIIITIISFFLSLFSSCSLAFSIGFLWVFTLVLR